MSRVHHKIDERKETVQKIKTDIENTQNNIEFTKDLIKNSNNPQSKQELEEKNDRRQESLDTMINRIEDYWHTKV